jgi:hypothetical protein
MQIDESDEQHPKAHLPINETLQPDSKVTVRRDLQSEKQYGQRFSTDEGMQIDESLEDAQKAYSPI